MFVLGLDCQDLVDVVVVVVVVVAVVLSSSQLFRFGGSLLWS